METSLLWNYRQKLEAKRSVGTPENLYEVLTPDWITYSSEIYDPTPIRRGVYNNGRSHWALAHGNVTISWVWDIANKSNTACITGATSFQDNVPDLLDRHKLGITQLTVDDIQEAADFLCKYAGCHHVLWNRRMDFVSALLYLILDWPEKCNPFKFLTVQTEVFYLNPAIFGFKAKNKLNKTLLKSFSYEVSNCQTGRYLKEANIDHSRFQYDEDLHEKLHNWANGAGKAIQTRVLGYELDWQARGLPLQCPIL